VNEDYLILWFCAFCGNEWHSSDAGLALHSEESDVH
jgi:hypothetical protein